MLDANAEQLLPAIADATTAVLHAAETVAYNRRRGQLTTDQLDALDAADTRLSELRRQYLVGEVTSPTEGVNSTLTPV
jgi:hypothetical protein